MKKKMLDPVGVYATYSDLFGYKYDKTQLIKLLHQMPLGSLLNILSQLNSIELEKTSIRKGFISFLQDKISDSSFLIDRIGDRLLYTPQGLLSVWKWLLAYGDWNKINVQIDLDSGIIFILYLHLIVSDYLHEENNTDLLYDFFSNVNFNSSNDAGASLARACIMYEEIARETSLFNPKEFMDINSSFLGKYGYTIKEYLSIVFAIHTSFIVEGGNIKVSGARSIEHFSNFSLIEKFEVIMNELSMTIEDARSWAEANIDRSWNYQLFKEKPLLKMENGFYLCISLNFLFEQVFNQLFFKIRECFPKDSEQIISFIGI